MTLFAASHADGRHVDQNIAGNPFRLGLPLETVLFCQRRAALAIACGDDHIVKTGIAKRGDNRFTHSTAAANHHACAAIELVAGNQAFYRNVVGVKSCQRTVVIDDGVDGINHFCGRVDGIQKRHTAFFERHRDRTAANSECANTFHCGLNILRGKGFVDKI